MIALEKTQLNETVKQSRLERVWCMENGETVLRRYIQESIFSQKAGNKEAFRMEDH